MPGLDILITNLLSPIVLTFVLGAVAGFMRSELELPESVLKLLSIYLLFSIGLVGGRELAHVHVGSLLGVFGVGMVMTVLIPMITFYVLRHVGKFDVQNSAALAAHYGSVSSVTFFAAIAFAQAAGVPADGFLAAVVAIMEWGVIVSLILAKIHMMQPGNFQFKSLMLDTLRGRGILLLTGGMIIGALSTDAAWAQVSPFYEQLFRGMLMLFLLEMGMTAARQIRDFLQVGRALTMWAIFAPVVFGVLGVTLAWWVGLGMGSAFVFGAICASASYIDAPAACRASLPQASPGIYLTASLGITFPFNLIMGLPIYFAYAGWLFGVS